MGAQKLSKTLERTVNLLKKSEEIGGVFSHFLMNEWIFLSNKTEALKEMLNPQEQLIFLMDPRYKFYLYFKVN